MRPRRHGIVPKVLLALVFAVTGIAETSSANRNQISPARNQIIVSNAATAAGGKSSQQTVTLRLPAGTREDSVEVNLNGKSVSSRFQRSSCANALCMTAVLAKTDGLRESKNVLTATAKNEDGSASSARIHLLGNPQSATSSRLSSKASLRPQGLTASPTLPTLNSFLPPSIAFGTLTPGGGQQGFAWLQIGSKQLLDTNACGSIYSVIVLDRQTLQAQTNAPENSPQCLNTSGALSAYLESIMPAAGATSPDLVIIGTTSGSVTDTLISTTGPFDTSRIGGRIYGCTSACTPSFVADRPQQYMAIGVPGAEPGSAYENYTTTTNASAAHATGMLIEDASGNYNFQPSGNVEYIVQPGATAADAYIQVNNAQAAPGINIRYWPPSSSNNADGFWLLVFDANTLGTVVGCTLTLPGNGLYIAPNCGKYYATGTKGGSPSNLAALVSDLSAVTSSQIAILTTVGTAGWGSAQTMASDIVSNPGGPPSGITVPLAQVLQSFGIPDKLFLQTGTSGSTFTMVGTPGLGGPLNGHNILSTNYLSRQGQTGYVHGTFAFNRLGLFETDSTQQEPGLNPATGVATDTANPQLGLVLSQQPVEWPELNAPLASGLTVAGQTDAYNYVSYYLLNSAYLAQQLSQSASPQDAVPTPLAYDIHYFFTGSLNTFLNYQVFDPVNVPFPAVPSGCGGCTWQGPDGTTFTFSAAEFAAVKVQLHNEIVDLTNVLTYFVTGSTNLKDIVASGSANTALALIQGFSTVQANITEQGIALAKTTKVKVSPWHIANMIANAISPYVSAITGGAVTGNDIKTVDKIIGIVGDVIKHSGGINGGLASGKQSSTADIPRLDYSLDTTVGDFAGLALQGQFLAGFDATLDSITSDWYKLNALGSSVISNQTLFSPTQATQNIAIAQITTAEQSSLYLSLIPAVFQDHVWKMTSGSSKVADMGYTAKGDTNTCSSFYPYITSPPTPPPPPSPSISVSYPTWGNLYFAGYSWKNTNNNPAYPFQYSANPPYQDWYVLALPFINPGYSNANAQVMTPALATILFGNGAGNLNFSVDEFVAEAGPMDQTLTGGSSVAKSSSSLISFAIENLSSPTYSPDTNAIGLPNSNICAQIEVNANAPVVGTPTPKPTPANATSTTLHAPANAVLGQDVVLQAQVLNQTSAVPGGGLVQFRDGATILQTAALDTAGSASYTTNALSLGQHTLSASFASTDGSLPSDSDPQVTTIYATAPDLQLSLSTLSLDVGYGSTSSPVSLQVQAISGMSGTVTYACTGLPVGMTCAFTPATASITDGGTTTTSFTITGSTTSAAARAGFTGLGTLAAVFPLLLVFGVRRGKVSGIIVPMLLTVLVVQGFSGCSKTSNTTTPLHETGSKTVLISATCGTLTKTTPLIVNIK
jgi:Bacterial Ig-like domain (group 3)